jgi:site-specific recombinase XerD
MREAPQPSFWQLARGFLREHCAARHLSADTVKAYKAGLECFLSYLADCGVSRASVGFAHFTRVEFKGWAKWMEADKGHAPKTIELRLTAVRSFLRYAAAEDLTLGAALEDVRSVKPPKAARQPVEHLPEQATAAILAAHSGQNAKSRRNRMMLVFLYDSAARVSEVANAKVGDLRLHGAPFVSLLGKGSKRRNMPLMGKTAAHLGVYLDEFHPDGGRDRPLFYSLKRGEPGPLSTDTVAAALKQAASTAKRECPLVPDRVHCHLIRKTRAMDLYQQGVPLALIMQMLGHESMATTSSFYAFATEQMMAEAIAAAVPAGLDQPEAWDDPATLNALYQL